MFRALLRTATKICDNEKAAYSFLNMFSACVLHLGFGVAVQEALFLVSPLSFLTLAQAYTEVRSSKQPKVSGGPALPFPGPSSDPVVPPMPGVD